MLEVMLEIKGNGIVIGNIKMVKDKGLITLEGHGILPTAYYSMSFEKTTRTIHNQLQAKYGKNIEIH